jgi:hypothetical protein
MDRCRDGERVRGSEGGKERQRVRERDRNWEKGTES